MNMKAMKNALTAIALVSGLAMGTTISATQTSVAQEKQELSQEHLDLALKTMLLGRGSASFESVIPNMGLRVKNTLIRQRPDLQADIISTTDSIVLEMADRVVELDRLIARGWALNFTMEELQEIAAFYSTPTGAKLAKNNTNILDATLKTTEKFATQMAQDIFARVKEEFQKNGVTF